MAKIVKDIPFDLLKVEPITATKYGYQLRSNLGIGG